jgi:hypothetical protein
MPICALTIHQISHQQKTELVEHPQVIENYLKLRTLVGHEQLRDFAFSDQESLQVLTS